MTVPAWRCSADPSRIRLRHSRAPSSSPPVTRSWRYGSLWSASSTSRSDSSPNAGRSQRSSATSNRNRSGASSMDAANRRVRVEVPGVTARWSRPRFGRPAVCGLVWSGLTLEVTCRDGAVIDLQDEWGAHDGAESREAAPSREPGARTRATVPVAAWAPRSPRSPDHDRGSHRRGHLCRRYILTSRSGLPPRSRRQGRRAASGSSEEPHSDRAWPSRPCC